MFSSTATMLGGRRELSVNVAKKLFARLSEAVHRMNFGCWYERERNFFKRKFLVFALASSCWVLLVQHFLAARFQIERKNVVAAEWMEYL